MMTPAEPISWMNRKRRSRAFRQTVLCVFSQGGEWEVQRLRGFSEREWRANLLWLDTSGLALYLLDRLVALRQQELVPTAILRRLQQNLTDNRARNDGLLAEALEVSDGFTEKGVRFALLKGITLSPESVPDSGLRCQLDLDFLVCVDDASVAGEVLERMGYELGCVSGDTWEYKAGGREIATVPDLYKVKRQRSAELHLASSEGLLARVKVRLFGGAALRVLSPVDLYLEQARHLFKHLCSSFTRAAWVLEHRRHMVSRRGDEAFWKEIEARAGGEARLALVLGVVTLLVSEVFDEVAPEVLRRMSSDHVSPAVRVWVETYGRDALLADFPGTKLYLLLRAALLPEVAGRHTAGWRDLVPAGGPPWITQRYVGESLAAGLHRYGTQLRYVLHRIRFHAVEGVRYFFEASRFRRLLVESVR